MLPVFTPKKIGPLGSSVPNKFVPQYRPNQLTSVTTKSINEEIPKKAVHFEPHPSRREESTAVYRNSEGQFQSQSVPPTETTTPSQFHAIAQASAPSLHNDDEVDASLFFSDDPRRDVQTTTVTNRSNQPSQRIYSTNSSGTSSNIDLSRPTPPPNRPSLVHNNATVQDTRTFYLDDEDLQLATAEIVVADSRKRRQEQANGDQEDDNTNHHHSTKRAAKSSSSSNNTATTPASSSATKKTKKSAKQQAYSKPIFPISYLKLMNYPSLNELDLTSPDKVIQHDRITTQLRLGPRGIPGILFSNCEERAVITAIHPIYYSQSPNARYNLQLYDVILSVNHLDAKRSTFEQLMKALNHVNETWDEQNANGSFNVAAELTISESSNPSSSTIQADIMSRFHPNTNIYITDMNDPNYHSNRSSLKNAIIEAMACVVFGRIRPTIT